MGTATRQMHRGYRPRGSSVGPVADIMVAASQYVALPGNQARADDLRRALGRVEPGLSPKLDVVIEAAGVALDAPTDAGALRVLLLAARDLKGVRLAPPEQQRWWDR
ncbi:hypothetical protein [Niveispirillum sp.]|uniref:hypothetical protein n=1 Tax=Niveispirillum sp. TaxID=1917217 RepID=UPI001B6A0A27|nr:hypothetical protein [Niveispirillum sp.]MBP7336887.1 hypothetical protein [Niveispirillum sp.]